MGVGENAATGLALVIHELATNSLKYGALYSPEGTLDVSGAVVGKEIRIFWSEQGGPAVSPPTRTIGSGSQLVLRTMEGTLEGAISYELPTSGVQVMMRIGEEHLAL